MDVLVITVLASLALGGGALLLLAKSIGQGDMEHGDRLRLLPLEGDVGPAAAESTSVAASRGADTEPS